MTIFVQNPGLGAGIQTAGTALGQALNMLGTRKFDQAQKLQEYQRKRDLEQEKRLEAQQTGNLLQQVLGSIGEEGGPSSLIQGLSQVLAQGGSPDIIQKFGTLQAALERSRPKTPFGEKTKDELVDLFQKFGMSPEGAERNADLYSSLTVGGQTSFAQQLMENIQRGNATGGGLFDVVDKSQEVISDPFSPEANVEINEEENFQFPEINPFQGLTPKEKTDRQKQLFDTNSKQFKEIQDSLKGFKSTALSIRQLTNLNNSNKLPKGIAKALNVNWKTGKLRIPALANAETQLFVKTINEFVKKARESFGARVTNFELDSFMQQLPTLANSEEGRRLILEQMDTVNKLNELYDDSRKEVFNKYGLYNIDPQQLEMIAERLRAPKERKLLQRFDQVANIQKVYQVKQATPKGKIPIFIQGQYGYIDPEEKEEAIQKGARLL